MWKHRLILSILLLAFVALPMCADTLGDTTAEASEDFAAYSAGPTCSKFTAAANGTVTSMSSYVKSSFGSANIQHAIYSDSSGPSAKLASSASSVSNPGTGMWATSTVSLSITSGTVYWLCMWADNGNPTAAYHGGAANQTAQPLSSPTFPSWPDPFGTFTSRSDEFSIYATYTPSGGGGGAKGAFLLLGC